MDRAGSGVSVVIPTYNRAHLVRDALDSVAAQSRPVCEIVVVDDGSDDGTEGVVGEWAAAARIPVRFVTQERTGGNAARNRGVEEAQGRHVAFLDSDDLWHPHKIAKQMAVLDASPGFGAVYCGLRETDVDSSAVIAVPGLAYPQGNLFGALLISDPTAPTSCWVVERQLLLDLGGFDTDLAARQDWDMWIRVAERTQIGCVPEILADLRHHSGPRTATDPNRELRAYRRILEKYALQRRSFGWRVQLPALASYHRRVGRVALRYQGRRATALWHYLAAIALWPASVNSWAALIGAMLPSGIRGPLRTAWNGVFGRTTLAIRSH